MVILFLYPHSEVSNDRVSAGEFVSHKCAQFFWEKFQRQWPRFEIEELPGHVEPEYLDFTIPVEKRDLL